MPLNPMSQIIKFVIVTTIISRLAVFAAILVTMVMSSPGNGSV